MTLHRFDVKMIKTTQNYQSDQMTMNCMHLTSNWQKCRVLSQNIQNNAKLQKWSKYNDFASIWCQNDQNNAKLPKRSNYDELHEFDVELAKMSSFVTKHSNNAKLQKWSKYNDLNRFDVELSKMSSFVTKHSKHRKTPKVIKVQWLCIDLMSKWSKERKTTKAIKWRWIACIWQSNWQKCRVLSQNIQNNAKLQKWSKYNDFASIWCQNDQNNAKLPKRSNDDELHAFDVELAKMSSFVTKHSIQRKTPKVIKIQWLESIWCRIVKNVEFFTKHSIQRKTPKVIKIQWLESIWCRIVKNVEFYQKTFKTTQNSKSDQNTMTLHRFDVKMIKTTQNYQIDQITMNCIDLTSNWQKCRVLSQNIQNNAKLQKWSKYNDLNRFDVELAKMSSFVTKHSKHRKTPKVIKVQWLDDLMSNWQKCRVLSQNIASIWCRIGKNVEFCHKTFKTTQKPKVIKTQWLHPKWSKQRKTQSDYDELHGFDVELAKMSSFVTKHSKQRKTPKVIKVQWLCIDLMSKWSKQRKTTKAIKLRWIAWIWRRIGKNVEFCHKTFNTTQNSKSDQNTMTWIDLMSNCQKCRVLSQNIQNTVKLQKWSKYNDFASIWCQNDQKNANWQKLPKRSNDDELHAFDSELAKMSSFVTKHSKQRKTPKVIKVQWLCIDLMSKWSKQRKTTKAIKYDELHAFDVELAKMSSFVTKHSIQRKTPKVIKIQWLESIWCRIVKNVEFFTKHSKQRKTPKVIKIQWLESIWCRIVKNVEFYQKTFKTTQNSKSDQNTMTLHRLDVKMIKTTQNYQIDQITMNCIDLTSNWQKCRVLSQNIQNNAKLQKWSKYNDLNRFDVELAKMSSFVTKHSKHRKTPKVIKVQWLCIDLMSNWQKCRVLSQNIQNNAKTKSDQNTMTLHRFDVKMIKTTQNYQIDQITMNCMDLTSNWQKCRVLSQNIQNNAKLQKWSKYNDFASIWCQNDQNNAKLPNWSNYDELHGFDVELAKMSSFVTKHSKHRKTPKVIKVQWLCIDLMSKWSKQRKTTKAIKWRWIACIWRRIGKNVEFCHKTFKTTQNSKSDQSTMTLHRFDVKMIKTTQNYQSDQITMNCMNLTSNWQKCRVLSQNIQYNAKLQKWSKYNDFDLIDQKCEFCHKTFKTTQNSKSDQNTMTWIDLMSNWQKCRVLSQNIQNTVKLQKWSKYNDFASIWCQNDQNNAKLPKRSNDDELHAFDIELAKMSSFVTKHSKQRKTPKVIKVQWLCIDLMSKWSKQRKTTKAIKWRWIASIWRRIGKNVEFCHKTFKTTQNSKSDQSTMTLHRFDVKMIKTTQNYQMDQMTMNCMHLTSNWQKCRVLSQNIQNNAKLQKWSKYNDFASIWCQNDQNNAKLPKRSNDDELHAFDVELAKMSSFVTKHSIQRKTPKVIKIQWLESIWCRIVKNVEFYQKTFKTTQNSKSDQSTMTLHRFRSKQRKTTKAIKWRWIACIWRRIVKKCRVFHKTFNTTQNSKSDQNTIESMSCFQNIQNNAKLQKWSKYNDSMSNWQKCRVLSQNIQNNAKLQKWSKYKCRIRKNVEFCHKTFKTTQNYQIDQITMNCMIWRRIGKNVEFCHKTFKTTQNSKSDQNTMTWIDLTSNWQKCRVLSQNIQNNAKLQKWSKYNDLNRFDVELAKMSSFVTKHSKHRKTPKVIKVQWLCIDLMSKWSKQRKTTKAIKWRWIACIWRRIGKNVEFCHKTFKTTQNSKSDQSTMTLHRFDVKMIKTTQNYQSDQITMNCMNSTSNWQKCRVLSQNIQYNAKLQKWSKYNDLNRFDVEL